ncbi:alpha/beta fold hydrolase [Phenylobacterium terrae]|uniref:Alpha/beta fold hydrolase n=1 Tax=Phenylobacterium terrae TaxID=2665495 RepID=A0ABW4MZ79_9CAUL
MDRRFLLQSLAAAGAVAAANPALAQSNRPRRKARPFVTTADGAQLAVRDWGEGPPVVLVHSWALNSEMWGQQVLALTEAGFRCIAYDRRGHGASSDPGRGYNADTLAGDLAAVMEALDVTGAVLVAHSMGSGEVARYLARGGERRVKAAALLAPTTPYLTKTADNPYGLPPQAWEQLRASWRKDFPKWVADNTPPFFTPQTSPATMQWGVNMLLRCPLPVAVACNKVVTDTDYRPDLAKVRVPFLVVHGDADASAPLDITGRRTAALVPHSRLVVIPGAPHGLFVTHADEVNRELIAFAKS